MRIGVLGATGRIGRLLVDRLVGKGLPVTAVVRSPERATSLPKGCEHRIADAANGLAVRAAFAEVTQAVGCTPAALFPGFVAALPSTVERIVLLGSARRYTKFPDARAEAMRAGERALVESARPGLMLHPTMIYGAQGENNLQRVAALVRRFRVVPLPAGGRSLIQPIFVEDVVACLEAALLRPSALGPPIVIAGPDAVSWAALVRAVGHAVGRSALILPLHLQLLRGMAWASRQVPGIPNIGDAEVCRLVENKNFSIEAMRDRLGIIPRSLSEGLAITFANHTSVDGSTQ